MTTPPPPSDTPPRKPRRTRPAPIEQGSYRELYAWFFGALTKYKRPDTDLKDWLEDVFHYRTREITRYTAKKKFTLPGLFYLAPLMPVQGLGYRDVRKDDVLFVRTDSTQPEVIDVEWHGGQGQAEQVFRLNPSEWGWVKLHLVEAERERKGRRKT